jgi:hypothetical protein
MSAYRRPLSAVPGLAVGFALAFGILGCHKRINNYLALPPSLVLSPEPGDVLTWSRPNTQITQFTLTFEKGFCALKPKGRETTNPDGTVSITAKDDETVECKVLPVPKGGGHNFVYSINMFTSPPPPPAENETSKATQGNAPSKRTQDKTKIKLMSPTIVSSCVGCLVREKEGPSSDGNGSLSRTTTNTPATTTNTPAAAATTRDLTGPSGITCAGTPTSVPVVNPTDTFVSLQDNYANWLVLGVDDTYTITFTGASPCYEGTTFQDVACTVKPSAHPNGAQNLSYPYTVSLTKCNGGTASSQYTLTLQHN